VSVFSVSDLSLRFGGVQAVSNVSFSVEQGEVFAITKVNQARNVFQGHRLMNLEGTFRSESINLSPGDYLVPLDQKLGRLVFSLLEPEQEDGVAAWGFLGEKLSGDYPIKKGW
jgi:hypothetical protein